MKKPRLRTADGKPQFRSVDDMLKEAASDEAIANLPGKGKPLDLRGYFAPSEEDRVAGKILKDNSVLPPHLQERKDAENLQEKAQELLLEAQQQIPVLRSDLLKKIEPLVCVFPDRQTCQTCLNIETWPEDYPEHKTADVQLDLKQLREMAQNLTLDIARYNARMRNIIYRYLDHLKKSQENIENYHKRQLLSITLSPNYNYLAPINIDLKEQEIRAQFPPMPEFPPDLPARLKGWYREIHPPMWQRILKFSSR
jgi:hypothetical protein